MAKKKPPKADRTLLVIGAQPPRQARGYADSAWPSPSPAAIDPGHVDPARLHDEIKKIVDALSPLATATDPGGLPLQSIVVELGVSAEGQVGILLTQASLAVSGRITVTLARSTGSR